MAEQLIHFDVAALIVLAITLVSQLTRNMKKGSTNRFFLSLVILTMLCAGADIWAALLSNFNYPAEGMHLAARTVYLLLYNSIPPFFLMYIISLTSTWSKVTGKVPLAILMAVPYVGNIILHIVNIFTGCLFTVPGGEFTVTELAFIPYSVAGLYIIGCIVYMIIYHRLFTVRKALALLLMLPIMGMVIMSQIVAPNTLIMIFGNAVGLMLISVLVQRPESVMDTFTGLHNYSAYADDMKKNYMTDSHTTLVLINIGNFDSLQKLLGYDRTGIMLKKIARKLNDCSRAAKSHAILYYLDRGRFRVVINSFNRGTAENAAQLINQALREPVKIEKFELNIIAYVCLARCPEDIPNFRSLMSFGGDIQQKLSYNGEVIYADSGRVKSMVNLLGDVDDIIDRAFANHGFQVYYQPIYSIEKKKFVSAEALLRLFDEKEGFVSPEIFIPAAEKSGAIHKIGDFVLNEVCRFMASDQCKQLGLEYIEVNLSVSQCMRHDLARKVIGVMEKYGVSSDQINLEITETAASYDQNVMSENLKQLSAAGISFSLDDYGTGYSNMSRIAALPLKIVKLDKSFVNSQTDKMWTVLQNTVKMIKDLNMEIVVEGIETADMVKKFSALKCDFIQGFYYSKPIPEQDFVKFISEKNKASV